MRTTMLCNFYLNFINTENTRLAGVPSRLHPHCFCIAVRQDETPTKRLLKLQSNIIIK